MTNNEINEVIKANRLSRFKRAFARLWEVGDVLLNRCFGFLIGASDNNAKNKYPYTFGSKKVIDGAEEDTDDAKFRMRDDDTDTIKRSDNQGADRKPYWVEWFDKDKDGNYYFNAARSGFMTLLLKAYFTKTDDEGFVMMRRVLQGLEDLGGSTAGSHLDRLMAWHKKYYEDVKDAFPAALVNDDMMRYERAKVAQLVGQYNEVDPLTQELGDHKSTERGWMKKRFVYIMSMFSFGDFAHGATSGTITFRLNGTANITVVPSIAMYPTADAGQTILRGARTMPGESCQLSWTGADLDSSVLGADWLTDIGEWYNMPIRNVLAVNARMLKRLILGTADPAKMAAMAIQITGLTANCASLRELDVQNIATLTGELDMRNSKLLQTAKAVGTQLSSLLIADGAPLIDLEYPATEQNIFLRDLPLLETSGVNYQDCAAVVTRFVVSNCAKLKPMKMLSDIIMAQESQGANHALQRVYVDGFDESSDDATLLDNLAKLADGYRPVDRDGYDDATKSVPTLSGTIRMTCPVYMDSIEKLLSTFGPGGLNIVFDSDKLYIRFEDPRVWEICAYNWGDVEDVRGKVIASGELEGNGDVDVLDDYIFAPGLVIAARTEDGVSIPQKAARTVDYRLEIEVEGGSGTPWDMDTTGDDVFLKVLQHPSNTATTTATHISATPNNYASVLTQEGNKWVATFQATNAAQYLRVAIRAAAGVKLKWSLTPLATGNPAWQPVGITQAQCAAVSSLGNKFQYNQIITAFAELKLFAEIKSFDSTHFYQCFNLSKLRLPAGTINVGSSFNLCDSIGTWNFYPDSLTTFNTCYNIYIDTMIVPPNVTSVASRAWSGSVSKRVAMRWMVFEGATPPTFLANPFYIDYSSIKIFVPDGSEDAYKTANNFSAQASKIYPLSRFSEFFPGESYERVT